eukprot:753723-Alexandrium_andersonii.AAC.1
MDACLAVADGTRLSNSILDSGVRRWEGPRSGQDGQLVKGGAAVDQPLALPLEGCQDGVCAI